MRIDHLRPFEHLPEYQQRKVNRNANVRCQEAFDVPWREGVKPVEHDYYREEDECSPGDVGLSKGTEYQGFAVDALGL